MIETCSVCGSYPHKTDCTFVKEATFRHQRGRLKRAEMLEPSWVERIDMGRNVTMWHLTKQFIVLKVAGQTAWESIGNQKYYKTHFEVFERVPELDTETYYGVFSTHSQIDFGVATPEWG